MEAASLWVTFVAAIAAVAAAVFSFVQAKAATDTLSDAREARDEARKARDESERLAAEANTAFKRQADAQEEANRLKKREMTPPDWSGPDHVSGQLFRVTNTSGGLLHVSSIDVHPKELANLVHLRSTQEDGRYDSADVIEYMSVKTMGGSAEKLTIAYTKEGSDEPRAFIVRL